MGIINFFKNQLSQVIEWDNQKPEILVYKFPSANDELKNASKLIIGPGQGALLVYEGELTDEINNEGIYDLETDNHPFITSLLKLRTNFESEHKLKIYFYRTSENVNQGWGTAQAVKYVDPVYKFPVELGANGTFSFKIAKPGYLFSNVLGSSNVFTVLDARQMLQSRFPQGISSSLAQSGVSYQQIDAQLPQLSQSIKSQINEEVSNLGFILTDFKLNSTTFDEATRERIGKIADITADAMAAGEGGLTYVELEKLRALRDAARNEGGLAGAGLQFGVGMEIGKTFDTIKNQQVDNAASADPVVKLQQLKLLLDEGIITQDEFDAKKKDWLNKF